MSGRKECTLKTRESAKANHESKGEVKSLEKKSFDQGSHKLKITIENAQKQKYISIRSKAIQNQVRRSNTSSKKEKSGGRLSK